MPCAPIALFTYNRPDHTKQAVESLLKNEEAKYSDLYIFSDGPKNEKAVEGVKANREYIHSLKVANDNVNEDVNSPSLNREGRDGSFRFITIIEREKNWGLAENLIAGITEIVNKYGRVIVVEDDLILSPYFLQFMNEALEKYADDDRVSAISGFLEPIDAELEDTFFLRYFDCWGWATWDRAWKLFNPDPKSLLRKIRWKTKEFNVGGYGGFYGMLYCQKVGLIDSWAIRFYASSFVANKLVLFPYESLVLQNGLDGTGTHCGMDDAEYSNMRFSEKPIQINDIPVVESRAIYKAFSHFYSKGVKQKKITRISNQTKSFVRRLIGLDHK